MDKTMNCLFKTTRREFLTARKKLKYPTTGLRKNPEVIEGRYDLHLFRSRRRETRRIIGASRSLQSRRRKAAEYDAFGKPYTGNFDNGIGNGYTGKPYDTVTGLYNYGYRDYSPTVARFTTVDPIRDGSNWFSYVKNDPVNYVDLWGLKPGDIFSTVDDAAKDFGNTYNDDSIRHNKECGASVYKVEGGYTYTVPSVGSNDSVIMSVPKDAPVEAYLHTHAAYDPKYGEGNNNFSSTDKNTAEKKGVDFYMVTPNGSLQVYDPSNDLTKIVSNNMPTDPSKGSDDKTIGFFENLIDHISNFFIGNSENKEENKKND